MRPMSINREGLSINFKPSVRGFKETFKGFSIHIQLKIHRRLMSYMLFRKQKGGFPDGKESACQYRGHGFNPCSGKIPDASEQLSL